MSNIQIFNNPDFGQIRTVEINGEPWLVGKDVATVLGYGDTAQAIRKHIDDEDKGVVEMTTPGGQQNTTIINESGLYSLVLSSKLPGAKKFKHWVTKEVLPSIRKTGVYISPQVDSTMMFQLAEAMAKKEQQIQALETKVEEDKPKVLFADAVAASQTSILVGELAKLLKQNGVDIGQNRLFAWLRTNGYLIRRQGRDYNMPTQRSMEMGLFEIKETVISHADGHTSVSKTPKVTGKGQRHFIQHFLGGEQVANANQ